jgi:hypothetical protein
MFEILNRRPLARERVEFPPKEKKENMSKTQGL